jgi:N-succinyldiaminopimelate aminotransferase
MIKEKFANRISPIKTSIFSTMSKLNNEYKAVNLGQGFPDFDGPEWIMDEAYKAMKSGKNQYAPSNGIYPLRQVISRTYKNHYDLDFNPDNEITITAGATEALYSTINAFIQEGDEVILFEPFYDSYYGDVLLAGGVPRFVTLNKPDFKFDFNELESLINPSTKMIILNNPHNPTGKVYSLEELEFISELVIKHDLIVLSDEVYEFLTFDGAKHIPIASLPGMKERTIMISSTGKTFGMTGWKVGYACCNDEFTKAIQKVHQWTTFTINTPGQHAMAYAFGRLDEYLPEFRQTYLKLRDVLYSGLKEVGYNVHLPKGSYFMLADIPENIRDNDIDFAINLVKQYGITIIPTSVFYGKSDEGSTMFRLCFAKKEETLQSGIERLRECIMKESKMKN